MNKGEIKAAAFLGRITAGVTHEIKNVLAIIKESSGLMKDILSMAEEGSIPYREKFDHALGTIEGQIDRGGELISQLNKFAHSSDQPVAKIDLHELASQVVSLSQRFARLKKVRLSMFPLDHPLNIETRPVELQMAIFACIECCLGSVPQGGQMHIHLQEEEEIIHIHTLCEADWADRPDFRHALTSSAEWTALQEVTADLGGTVVLDNAAPGVILSFPMK